jgi:vanillate O-demethylase ferredoxin subunit
METTPARVAGVTGLSEDISDFRFESSGAAFTGLEPGAHVDVHLPNGLVRQYSIWDWAEDGSWVSVAVKREDNGRGGSLAMHALREGEAVRIGGPRNNFTLDARDQHITLIAGGIGVTPIFAMARALKARGAEFRVYYLVRNADMAAFDGQFRALDLDDRYHLHCDATDGMIDLHALMAQVPAGGDVYTCGPEPMLNAVLDAGQALSSGAIRFERFAAASDLEHAPNEAFEIEVGSTGAVFEVGAEDTILHVLKANGIDVDFGCSEGLCGSCITDVLSGDIDHRDGVLSPEEQETNSFMCVCVSRARSRRLVLDL